MTKLEDLIIYKKSLELVKKIYKLIRIPLLSRDFSLCDQLKRASISVATNISEGYLRSRKQTKNYLEISSGSTNEVATILHIVNLIYGINTKELQEEYIVLGKQINAFSSSF